MNTTEIQRLIRDYYRQIYANKLHNLVQMDKFIVTHNTPRMNQKNRKPEQISNELRNCQ